VVANILEKSVAASSMYPEDGRVSSAETGIIMYWTTHHVPTTKVLKFTNMRISD
jgi:hypothetical protein